MLGDDFDAALPTVAEQISDLLKYLAAGAREVGPSPVRDVRNHDVTVWSGDVPAHPAVTIGTAANEAWMEVKRVAAPAVLPVPIELRHLLGVGEHLTDPVPRPRALPDKIVAQAEQRVKDDLGPPNRDDNEAWTAWSERAHQVRSDIAADVEAWLREAWTPWATRTRPAFEARALYSELYDLHLKEDAESATHEVVWGHLLLSWRGATATVHTPMLATPVTIEVDPVSAAIRVIAEGPLELELDALEGTDLPGLEGLVRLQSGIHELPPDPWDADARQQARWQIIAPLGVDAELHESTGSVIPDAAPRLDDGWVIMKRRRPMRQERFYDELASKIREQDHVPEALASVVADRDRVDEAVRESGREMSTDDGTADRLMMPLPTNAEQERIARQLATSRGVTVQGPPGTGKSHTIVNLVSHLVAQGKRVLVTAEKEQALSVLREKIPEQIRDLSIAVLGSTPAAMEELRSAAQGMQDSLSSIDVAREAARIAELGARVDELREQSLLTDTKLVEALRSEQREYVLPSGPTRAPQVAEWLANDRELDTIDDAVPPDVQFPLTADEMHELVRILGSVSAVDAAAAMEDLPTDEWIPAQVDLEDKWRRQEILRGAITTLEDDGLRIEGVDSIGIDATKEIAQLARESAETLSRLGGDWEDVFARAIRDAAPSVGWMMPHNAAAQEELSAARGLADRLVGHNVVVPEGDPATQGALMRDWHERISGGKKVSVFARREIKDLNAATRVDDYPVTTIAQLELVWLTIDLRARMRRVHTLMTQAYGPLDIPVPPLDGSFQFAAEQIATRVSWVHTWWRESYRNLTDRLRPLVALNDPATQPQRLAHAAELLDRAIARAEERDLTSSLQTLKRHLTDASQRAGASSLWGDLLGAVEFERVDLWGAAVEEARRLLSIRAKASRADDLLRRITAAGAPKWAAELRETRAAGHVAGDLDDVKRAWDRARARTWLASLHSEADVEALMSRSHADAQELQRTIVDLASRSARVELKQNIKDRQRRALDAWLTAVQRVGKGTGKTAPRFRAAARDALPTAMGAVPVWIMPIYRVLENFDPRRSDLFDVVVVDEASQCDLLTLGVLALGKKAVVVGDDKQTTPNLVGTDTSRMAALQDQHLRSIPDSKLLTLDESLYSIAGRAFPSLIALREHFRCVPEIIRYSNRYYDGTIKPLREVSVPQIGEPVRVVRVEDAVSERHGSSRINRREALVVADRVAVCASDPAYEGLTFGVVTMMSGPQAQIIQDLIRDRIGDAEFERRRLRVGNPPVFQGDERSVIFISMVAHDNSSAATQRWHAQWANVAASRAQDQLWIFHSMDPSALHHRDERRAMIDYARAAERGVETEDLYELTESKFERDVLQQMLDRGYAVDPQHRVGSYRIDFVVRVAPGERLAVECDGDSFHGPEKWDDDVRRQRVLERLGWTFWRVRASAYYLDPSAAMQPLWNRLEEMRQRAVRNTSRRQVDASGSGSREGQSDDAFSVDRGAKFEPTDPTHHIAVQDRAEHSAPVPHAGHGTRPESPRHFSASPDSTSGHRDTPDLDAANVRHWARFNGYEIGDRGRISGEIRAAYIQAHGGDE